MEQTATTESDVFYLPYEIIRNILKRLPVISLIRFQCVCKDWKNLIQNSSFIVGHLQHSSHQNPSLLFECNEINIPSHRRLHELDCGLQVREVQKAPLIDSLKDASVVGSCNGLLLVETYNKYPPSLLLWNPATIAVRHVPRTDYFDFDDCVTAFGFSQIVDDYKILRIYVEHFNGVNRVEVFSLRRGSWKRIDIGNLKRVKLYHEVVMADGSIFWTGVKLGAGEEGEGTVEVIVYLEKEVFTFLPWPELYYDGDEKLIVYEHKFAKLWDIYGESDEGTPDLIELWVLDKVTCPSSETWSWTKTYTSSPFSGNLDPLTILRNEIVCNPYPREDGEEGRDVLYLVNLTTNEVKRFVIPYCGHAHSFKEYVESLVSVGNN